MFKATKRFIAGAVCPRCGEMDSLMTWDDTEHQRVIRECVSCDFEDQMDSMPTSVEADLKTRVSEGVHEKVVRDEGEQPLKILNHPQTDSDSSK